MTYEIIYDKYDDNRYRWRLGDYRIIGIVENNTFKLIQIIKIAKRDENTYRWFKLDT